MATEKAGKTNIVASNGSHDTADGNDYLGQKKTPSKSTYIGPKIHIVATWGTIKELNFSTPLGDSSWHALPNLPKLADILA